MKNYDISVIISTYNSPTWLQKVLWSFEQQTFKDFEVVIADDGSGEDTKSLIDSMSSQVSY
ncbi:MAG: glycosyltransferase, partial [Psychroserpens sp.]|nr:glycosyltransferase [Psychroserpens sp.]